MSSYYYLNKRTEAVTPLLEEINQLRQQVRDYFQEHPEILNHGYVPEGADSIIAYNEKAKISYITRNNLPDIHERGEMLATQVSLQFPTFFDSTEIDRITGLGTIRDYLRPENMYKSANTYDLTRLIDRLQKYKPKEKYAPADVYAAEIPLREITSEADFVEYTLQHTYAWYAAVNQHFGNSVAKPRTKDLEFSAAIIADGNGSQFLGPLKAGGDSETLAPRYGYRPDHKQYNFHSHPIRERLPYIDGMSQQDMRGLTRQAKDGEGETNYLGFARETPLYIPGDNGFTPIHMDVARYSFNLQAAPENMFKGDLLSREFLTDPNFETNMTNTYRIELADIPQEWQRSGTTRLEVHFHGEVGKIFTWRSPDQNLEVIYRVVVPGKEEAEHLMGTNN